jgi:23S rRNA (pseudouridine1915-N3)-methyltransferase
VRLTVATVGRPRDRAIQGLCDDYANRIRRHSRLDFVQVREGQGTADTMRLQESDALRRIVPARAQLVVLDERGDALRSVDLAERMRRAMNDGTADWVLAIGGANGHTPAFRSEAAWCWSLSPLTLPHELALLVVMEQLYRAGTILRGEPYHRDG